MCVSLCVVAMFWSVCWGTTTFQRCEEEKEGDDLKGHENWTLLPLLPPPFPCKIIGGHEKAITAPSPGAHRVLIGARPGLVGRSADRAPSFFPSPSPLRLHTLTHTGRPGSVSGVGKAAGEGQQGHLGRSVTKFCEQGLFPDWHPDWARLFHLQPVPKPQRQWG